MIVYKDYLTFDVLGDKINIFSVTNEYGLNTVVELQEGVYYHLGKEPISIQSVLFAVQDYYKVEFTTLDIDQIMKDNFISSSGI